MKRAAPKLGLRMIRIRPPLTEQYMQHRHAYCRVKLARQPAALQEYLSRIVWIDAKKYYVQPEPTGKVLVNMATTEDAELVRVDPRAPFSSHRQRVTIVWYTAVNAAVGPVFFGTVTGTTGQDKGWEVSSGIFYIITQLGLHCHPQLHQAD